MILTIKQNLKLRGAVVHAQPRDFAPDLGVPSKTINCETAEFIL